MRLRILFSVLILVATASAQTAASGNAVLSGGYSLTGGGSVTSGSPFYGLLFATNENEASLVPSDYVTPTDPGLGLNNVTTDTVFGTPVWKMCNAAIGAASDYTFSVPIDDLDRWGFCDNLDSNLATLSKKAVDMHTGATYCNIANLDIPAGPGHRNIVREQFTATGYVVSSTVTIVSGSIPEDRTLTNTDIVINGTTYQISNDNATLTLQQAGVNVGSVGAPVSITAGWNDQDVLWGVMRASNQIIRVNLRVCNAADTSQTTGPTQPSWEVWDTIKDASSKWGNGLLFSSMEMAGNVYDDMSDDGNSFLIGDNTNSTGNTYDPRRYTLGAKGGTTSLGGTVSGPTVRYGWAPITSLTATSGTNTATVVVTGSPDYRVGENMEILSPNMCCAAAGAGGFKHNGASTCYVNSVTDANHFTVQCSPNFTANISDTSGYVSVQGRSAFLTPPLPNVPTVGAGGDHFIQYQDAGSSSTCQNWPISNISATGGTATVVLSSAPYPALTVGAPIGISGTTNYNSGSWITPAYYLVASVVNSTTFTFAKTGTPATETVGNAYVCGENVQYLVDSSSGATIRKIVGDAGHITGYIGTDGDWHVIQYANKYVNSATQGYLRMTTSGDNCELFDWNFRTDALHCMIDATHFDPNFNEFYASYEATRRSNPHPYVIITQTGNSLAAMPFPKYNNLGGLPTSNTAKTISTISRDGAGNGTIVLSSAPTPNWVVGDPFTVNGTTNFGGTYTVVSKTSSTTYTFAKTGAAVSESIGTANVPNTVTFTAAGTAGDCHSSGGTATAFCKWIVVAGSTDGNVSDWVSMDRNSYPQAAGTITVSGGTFAGTQNYDWTKQWIYKCCSYANGVSSTFVPTAFSGEAFIYDITTQNIYHLAHTYTRQIMPFYFNSHAYNENAHVTTSRDGKYACFDSAHTNAKNVSAYCIQVLR